MQPSPILRTFRYFFLSVGFILFITVAMRAAHQVNDPRYIKGSPFMQTLATSAGVSQLASVQTASGTKAAVVTGSDSSQGTIQQADQPSVTVDETSITNNGGNVPQGKALGVVKHTD